MTLVLRGPKDLSHILVNSSCLVIVKRVVGLNPLRSILSPHLQTTPNAFLRPRLRKQPRKGTLPTTNVPSVRRHLLGKLTNSMATSSAGPVTCHTRTETSEQPPPFCLILAPDQGHSTCPEPLTDGRSREQSRRQWQPLSRHDRRHPQGPDAGHHQVDRRLEGRARGHGAYVQGCQARRHAGL